MHYHGRSIGRIIEYLREYCGEGVAGYCNIGQGEVWLHGELFATYEWRENHEVEWPVFVFYGNSSEYCEEKQHRNLQPRFNFFMEDSFQEAVHQRNEAHKLLDDIEKLLNKIPDNESAKMDIDHGWSLRLAKSKLEKRSGR